MCIRDRTDYLDLLHDWQERYKPATPEEPHDPRFEEALHTTETIEHLTACVAFGTPQQKAAAAARLLSGSYLLMLEERIDRLALAKCCLLYTSPDNPQRRSPAGSRRSGRG